MDFDTLPEGDAPVFKIGDLVLLTTDHVVVKDAIVKSPSCLFVYPEVVAKKGLVGTVIGIHKNSLCVEFNKDVLTYVLNCNTHVSEEGIFRVYDATIPFNVVTKVLDMTSGERNE